ncbi:MAG: alanine racemase, partial [Kordiimonadaceae bacterium]|nr:alanine racemase [Kordiimonadaceae bacterium]
MKTPNVLANASASLNVDLSAIIGNYQTLSSQSSSADCAAVVKANAYGLGMEQVASAIYNNTDCKIFFVANLLEAISLRKILPEAIIYVFNGLFEDQIDTYTEYNIRPILNNIDQIAL